MGAFKRQGCRPSPSHLGFERRHRGCFWLRVWHQTGPTWRNNIPCIVKLCHYGIRSALRASTAMSQAVQRFELTTSTVQLDCQLPQRVNTEIPGRRIRCRGLKSVSRIFSKRNCERCVIGTRSPKTGSLTQVQNSQRRSRPHTQGPRQEKPD